jgi:FkbM family methyltransferase
MSLVLNLVSRGAFAWRRDTVKGRILRLPLRAIPKGTVFPVLSGPAKGIKWSTGVGPADFWMGTYEKEKAKLLTQNLKPGGVVYDVGANFGFYTLLSSRAVGPEGRVVAFEPAPRTLSSLYRHLSLNCCTNVQVLEVAVSESEGVAQFLVADTAGLSKMTATGNITVRTIALDGLMGELPLPDLIEMDIEGAEYAALRGAERLLRNASPVIFLSTHGAEVHRACCKLLRSLGYRLHPIGPRPIDETDELFCARD